MFLGLGNTERLVGILSDVCVRRKSKMAVINRKYRYEITYISARTHDSNEISTATPPFSRSSNSVELVLILPDLNGSQKSKMIAVKLEMHVYQLVDMTE